MKKTVSLFLTLFSFILGLSFSSSSLAAAENPIGFDIQMIRAKNQINKSSFFDLRVKPKQRETIYVKVNNTSSKKASYAININQAYTNNQGFIDYSNEKESNKIKSKYKTSSMIKYPRKITINAESSKKIPINIHMPDEEFNGQILSGVKVTKIQNGNQKDQITNKYGYILGLRVTENDKPVKRDLKLNKVYAKTTFGKPTVISELKNPTMDAYGHLKYQVTIVDRNSDKSILKKNYDNNMQLAPNSTYDFASEFKRNQLVAGDYTIHLKVSDAKHNVWSFTRNFVVTQDQVSSINAATINKTPQKTSYLLWIIIALLLILIIVGAYIVFKLIHKDKQKSRL